VNQGVSKIRWKRARERDRQATGRHPLTQVSINENPAAGLAIAVAVWAACVFALGARWMLGVQADASLWRWAGIASLWLVALLGVGLFLQVVNPALRRSNSRVLLLAFIALLAVVCTKGLIDIVGRLRTPPPAATVGFLLPFALAPILATILLDRTSGLAVGIWTSLVIAQFAGRALPLPSEDVLIYFVTGLVATAVAVSAARRARTRARVLRTGLIVGISQVTCVFALTALHGEHASASGAMQEAGACLASAVLSSVVVLLVLPFAEMTFRVTTDITLLELSDLGHPLLQRLALEAPGTYHHSLVVANLAQAAAAEIGANSLLARICAYFHDVGKLTKPDFFIENQQFRSNPHDDLPPSMSTLVITSHVKEGISLAMLHKLPAPVVQVIREHHGTCLLSYFHHKAKAQQDELAPQDEVRGVAPSEVDESGFRYGGPRPTSRESAIVALADAVEAASRALERSGPGQIEGLVDEVVRSRLEDGQLDDCDLTLSELTRVKRSFIFTLTNMLHARVPYPRHEDRTR
jgi:cyclic-di-AMP phosphodiesterase PgpH